MRILKFGGKSLSSFQKTQNICKNIKKIYKNDKKIIVVVSAISNTTDNLCKLANEYSSNNPNKNELAKLLSTGETQSSALFSMMLNSLNVPAKSFSAHELSITTYGDPLNSRIAYINKQPILDCFKENKIAVVAGFQGINNKNEITTLGRGGSDTTAAALAAIFETDVEIYSDYDGVFAGDPKLLNFKKLKTASYNHIINSAISGAKVLDHRAVSISKNYNIKIISKSSQKIFNSGTVVSPLESDVITISSIDNLCQISIDFSNQNKLQFLSKNVLKLLKDIKFYNFKIEFNKIKFTINNDDKLKVLNLLAKKLNLLKNSTK